MSLFKITEDTKDYFTLETHPVKTYSSSSSGTTGSIYIFARRSDIEKETQPLSMFSSSFYNDENLSEVLELAKYFAVVSGSNEAQISGYLSKVSEQQISARKQQKMDIFRFNPPFEYNSNTARKLITQNTLMPFYRSYNHNYNNNVSNYFCFNFFTSSKTPTDAVILYPNPTTSDFPHGQYTPTNAWSFDFWINPKYTTDTETNSFKPGTIFHLSGVYAISLVSGSSKDINGLVDGYRIQVQLSSSANTPPDLASVGPLIFQSTDNSLERNKWHHVVIRHGGTEPLYNFGTGSIVIDNIEDSNFVLTSSLVSGTFGTTSGPIVLCVGNYYEGSNSGSSEMDYFFAHNTSIREGLYELNSNTIELPSTFSFQYPLNAEIHELKIYNKYLNNTDISYLNSSAPKDLSNILFYAPPMFTYESPTQSFYLGHGGIPVTPFQTKTDSTHDLFNITMSYTVGGQFINLENYVKDFATGRFPRLLNLTSSIINETSDAMSANEFLFSSASNRYRQYIMMPCDNGRFYPNYDFLKTGSLDKFKNDLENISLGKVNLNNLVENLDKANVITRLSGSTFEEDFVGATPENVSGSYKDSLSIFHRTRDNSSNQCVLFDISNMFFGNRITPNTFEIKDTSLSGSGDKISITIKDDGNGGLYKANCNGPQATWSNIGNIFYNEGIVYIKSPQLYFFGENQYEINFKGEQNIHVLKFNLDVFPLTATSSSNPSYIKLSASNLANDTDQDFVWLSGLMIHDDNLNVIAKTNFAQPIMKRSGDKIRINTKIDF